MSFSPSKAAQQEQQQLQQQQQQLLQHHQYNRNNNNNSQQHDPFLLQQQNTSLAQHHQLHQQQQHTMMVMNPPHSQQLQHHGGQTQQPYQHHYQHQQQLQQQQHQQQQQQQHLSSVFPANVSSTQAGPAFAAQESVGSSHNPAVSYAPFPVSVDPSGKQELQHKPSSMQGPSMHPSSTTSPAQASSHLLQQSQQPLLHVSSAAYTAGSPLPSSSHLSSPSSFSVGRWPIGGGGGIASMGISSVSMGAPPSTASSPLSPLGANPISNKRRHSASFTSSDLQAYPSPTTQLQHVSSTGIGAVAGRAQRNHQHVRPLNADPIAATTLSSTAAPQYRGLGRPPGSHTSSQQDFYTLSSQMQPHQQPPQEQPQIQQATPTSYPQFPMSDNTPFIANSSYHQQQQQQSFAAPFSPSGSRQGVVWNQSNTPGQQSAVHLRRRPVPHSFSPPLHPYQLTSSASAPYAMGLSYQQQAQMSAAPLPSAPPSTQQFYVVDQQPEQHFERPPQRRRVSPVHPLQIEAVQTSNALSIPGATFPDMHLEREQTEQRQLSSSTQRADLTGTRSAASSALAPMLPPLMMPRYTPHQQAQDLAQPIPPTYPPPQQHAPPELASSARSFADGSAALAAPRRQSVRSHDDLYTPEWVRYDGVMKEGFCGLCDPPGRWLQLKNSAFCSSFMVYLPVSGRPFVRPLSLRVVYIATPVNPASGSAHPITPTTPTVPGPASMSSLDPSGANMHPQFTVTIAAEGLCHQCGDWHPASSKKRKGGANLLLPGFHYTPPPPSTSVAPPTATTSAPLLRQNSLVLPSGQPINPFPPTLPLLSITAGETTTTPTPTPTPTQTAASARRFSASSDIQPSASLTGASTPQTALPPGTVKVLVLSAADVAAAYASTIRSGAGGAVGLMATVPAEARDAVRAQGATVLWFRHAHKCHVYAKPAWGVAGTAGIAPAAE
ncbi:hypothetical protein DFJ73DRAFT_865860 [Zopfochytrium polystomum]|nr:hypothetical protein DFJ73DRAFT_865860 [Zopfochytrium polystomum]